MIPFCYFLLHDLVFQCPPFLQVHLIKCQCVSESLGWLMLSDLSSLRQLVWLSTHFRWGQEVLFQGMCFGEEPKALVCVTVGEFKGKRDGPPAGSPRYRRSMVGCFYLLLLHQATTPDRIWHLILREAQSWEEGWKSASESAPVSWLFSPEVSALPWGHTGASHTAI